MQVAAGRKGQPVAEPLLKLVAHAAHLGIVEPIVIAGMRRGYHVGDSVGDGVLRHSQRLLDIVGAVVDTRKDVAVQIDHGSEGVLLFSLVLCRPATPVNIS